MAVGQCAPGQRLAGYGAVWQYCDPLSGDWVTFAGLKDVTDPKISGDPLETTSQDGDGYETWIPAGVNRIEDLSIAGDFLIEQYDRIRRFKRDGTITRWRRVLTQIATEPYLEFCAFVLDFMGAFPLKDMASLEITLKASGAPEFGELSG